MHISPLEPEVHTCTRSPYVYVLHDCLHYLPQDVMFLSMFIYPIAKLRKKFSSNFAKPCKIIAYCYGKDSSNSGVDFTQNGQLSDILDFCHNIIMWISKTRDIPMRFCKLV